MILVCFQGKLFNITVIQVWAPATNAEEDEVERFCENLQDLVGLTPKRHVLFTVGYWNAKIGSQEITGITGKFGLGLQNEAGLRLTDFCQENTLVIAYTIFQKQNRCLCTWKSPNGQYQNQIDNILCSRRLRKYTQQKQDRELTVAKIMNSLLQNSDLN